MVELQRKFFMGKERKELALLQHELFGGALLLTHYSGYDTGIFLTPVP